MQNLVEVCLAVIAWWVNISTEVSKLHYIIEVTTCGGIEMHILLLLLLYCTGTVGNMCLWIQLHLLYIYSIMTRFSLFLSTKRTRFFNRWTFCTGLLLSVWNTTGNIIPTICIIWFSITCHILCTSYWMNGTTLRILDCTDASAVKQRQSWASCDMTKLTVHVLCCWRWNYWSDMCIMYPLTLVCWLLLISLCINAALGSLYWY